MYKRRTFEFDKDMKRAWEKVLFQQIRQWFGYTHSVHGTQRQVGGVTLAGPYLPGNVSNLMMLGQGKSSWLVAERDDKVHRLQKRQLKRLQDNGEANRVSLFHGDVFEAIMHRIAGPKHRKRTRDVWDLDMCCKISTFEDRHLNDMADCILASKSHGVKELAITLTTCKRKEKNSTEVRRRVLGKVNKIVGLNSFSIDKHDSFHYKDGAPMVTDYWFLKG